MSTIPKEINLDKLPKHIAVIMDGNGRWAKQHNRPRVFGHRNGVKAVREVTESCAEIGIEYLTLYAFSTENWNRPTLEVNALMTLLVETVRMEMKTLMDNNIRLRAIGDLTKLPPSTYQALQEGIAQTASNTRMTLTLALNYSSKWEIVEAVKKIAKSFQNTERDIQEIDDLMIERNLATAGMPDPELLIRTSGEHRISNYMLWQIAYTELYFTDTLWPDFRRDNLYEAILDFQNRERRFGKTSEQIAGNIK